MKGRLYSIRVVGFERNLFVLQVFVSVEIRVLIVKDQGVCNVTRKEKGRIGRRHVGNL